MQLDSQLPMNPSKASNDPPSNLTTTQDPAAITKDPYGTTFTLDNITSAHIQDTMIKSSIYASPRLFALVIGINDYQTGKKLLGAVNDADAVNKFLTDTMSVHPSNIINLRDKKATRELILTALNGFCSNSHIQKNDPILIYYAGHGGQANPPKDWEAGGPNEKIQMLLPQDFDPKSKNPERGQGILDKDFGHILNRIAFDKGNNITVILDCCHSGSGTRNDKNSDIDSTSMVRRIDLPDDYTISYAPESHAPESHAPESHATDANRGTKIPALFDATGRASHVLLAACREDQSAVERESRGIFTKRLLERLNGTAIDIDKITYEDLIKGLQDLSTQNPRCEGTHSSRILFDAKVPNPRKNLLHPIQKEGGKYFLEFGMLHRIRAGAEFAVYTNQHLPLDQAQSIATLIAHQVKGDRIQLKQPDSSERLKLPTPAFAFQTKAGKEPDLLLFSTDEQVQGILEKVKDRIENKHISLVEDGDAHDLTLSLGKDEDDVEKDVIVFHIANETWKTHGLHRMPHYVKFKPERLHDLEDELHSIISGAAHFYSYLRSTMVTGYLANWVEVQCHELRSEGPYSTPVTTGDNLNVNGIINIHIEEGADKMYGFKIINKAKIPLFFSLFYFDLSDLSINSYCQAGSGAGMSSAIQPDNNITIGYGAGGYQAREYFLHPDQEVDVGMLKLFITTDTFNSSSIPQESPFNRSGTRGDRPKDIKQPNYWDTVQIPVILREAK